MENYVLHKETVKVITSLAAVCSKDKYREAINSINVKLNEQGTLTLEATDGFRLVRIHLFDDALKKAFDNYGGKSGIITQETVKKIKASSIIDFPIFESDSKFINYPKTDALIPKDMSERGADFALNLDLLAGIAKTIKAATGKKNPIVELCGGGKLSPIILRVPDDDMEIIVMPCRTNGQYKGEE